MSAPDPQSSVLGDTSDDLFLGGLLRVLQPLRGYRAGTDAVLLASSLHSETLRGPVLDAGAGVGVVGLCVAARCPDTRVTLVEREPYLASLALQNIARNGLADRVSIIEADIARPSEVLEKRGIASESFAAVLANPPYHEDRRGTASRSPLKAASHQMAFEDLDVWARFLCRMAAPGGRAIMIHKAEALAAILSAFEGRFGSVRVLPIQARAADPAIRVIVEGIKGSRAPLTIGPALVLHGADHAFVPEVEAVFRAGAALPHVVGG